MDEGAFLMETIIGGEDMSVELVHVIRGELVESIHRGDIVVVDIKGNIIYEVGDKNKITFWRSSAKPFQVLPMIEAGGVDKFGFTGEEIALMTASHGGEEEHVKVLKEILSKLGLDINTLDCGKAHPMYNKATFELFRKGEDFERVHNACSGKHASMLALALLKDYDIMDYIKIEHEVQREMVGIVCEMTELEESDINIAIDGCGVPVFGLPIYNMALAYAKLSKPEIFNNKNRRDALKLVGESMTSNPFYVAGSERLDTVLMEVTKGRLLAKLGAESVYCISVMDKGIGIALKIEDGSYRAIDPAVIELLKRLDFITKEEFEQLKSRWEVEIKNHRKEVVGVIKAVF